jgi:hypothetical protein
MKRRIAGFTMIETLTSSAVLSIVVFAAVGASHSAMRATSEVVTADSTCGRVQSSLDRLRTLLLAASNSTLQAIPASYGKVAEPMQDGVTYSDLSFRTGAGLVDGAIAYVPATDLAPYHLYFEGDQRKGGSLMLDTGRSQTALIDDVQAVTFQRNGKELKVTFTAGTPGCTDTTQVQLGVVLLVP